MGKGNKASSGGNTNQNTGGKKERLYHKANMGKNRRTRNAKKKSFRVSHYNRRGKTQLRIQAGA